MSSGSSMSLRQRFVLLVCLAVVALVAAGLAIVELQSRSAAALESTAIEHGEDAVALMLQKIGGASAITPEDRPGLQRFVTDLVTPLGDASAGYCTTDGGIALEANGPRFHTWVAHPRGPHPHGGPSPLGRPEDRGAEGEGASKLFPIDREAVADVCGGALHDKTMHARVPLGQDVLILSARAADSGLVAWALVTVPSARTDDAGLGWATKIGVIGLATLLLVVLAVDALRALRRGAADLEVGLLRLQDDLRAEIARPRARAPARPRARAPASSRASRSGSAPWPLTSPTRTTASARWSAASGTSSASRGSGAWSPAWLTRSGTRSPGSSSSSTRWRDGASTSARRGTSRSACKRSPGSIAW